MNNKIQDELESLLVYAIKNGQFVDLLLGDDPFTYRNRWTPTSDKADISEYLRIIYSMECRKRKIVGEELICGLYKISSKYEGIYPTVSCLFFEAYAVKRNKPIIGIPALEIINKLSDTIYNFKTKLMNDFDGPGMGFKDGKFGDLKRLSQIYVSDLDGMSFL